MQSTAFGSGCAPFHATLKANSDHGGDTPRPKQSLWQKLEAIQNSPSIDYPTVPAQPVRRLRRVHAIPDMFRAASQTSFTSMLKKKDSKVDENALQVEDQTTNLESAIALVQNIKTTFGRKRPSLERKQKKFDLRSEYSNSINSSRQSLDAFSMSPLASMSDLQLVPANAASIIAARNPEDAVYCSCRRPFSPKLGAMVCCGACTEWYHLSCVGQSHKDPSDFEKEAFFCPSCEDIAFQELVMAELA